MSRNCNRQNPNDIARGIGKFQRPGVKVVQTPLQIDTALIDMLMGKSTPELPKHQGPNPANTPAMCELVLAANNAGTYVYTPAVEKGPKCKCGRPALTCPAPGMGDEIGPGKHPPTTCFACAAKDADTEYLDDPCLDFCGNKRNGKNSRCKDCMKKMPCATCNKPRGHDSGNSKCWGCRMSEGGREARRERERERKSKMSEEQKAEASAKKAKKKKDRRSKMSEGEKAEAKAKDAKYQKDRRSRMSEGEKAEANAKNAKRKRLAYAAGGGEKRRERWNKKSEEEKAADREKWRERYMSNEKRAAKQARKSEIEAIARGALPGETIKQLAKQARTSQSTMQRVMQSLRNSEI